MIEVNLVAYWAETELANLVGPFLGPHHPKYRPLVDESLNAQVPLSGPEMVQSILLPET